MRQLCRRREIYTCRRVHNSRRLNSRGNLNSWDKRERTCHHLLQPSGLGCYPFNLHIYPSNLSRKLLLSKQGRILPPEWAPQRFITYHFSNRREAPQCCSQYLLYVKVWGIVQVQSKLFLFEPASHNCSLSHWIIHFCLPSKFSPPSPKQVRPTKATQNTPWLGKALKANTIYPHRSSMEKITIAGLRLGIPTGLQLCQWGCLLLKGAQC